MLPFQVLTEVRHHHMCRASGGPDPRSPSWRPPCPTTCPPSLKIWNCSFIFTICCNFTFNSWIWHQYEWIFGPFVCRQHIIYFRINTWNINSKLKGCIMHSLRFRGLTRILLLEGTRPGIPKKTATQKIVVRVYSHRKSKSRLTNIFSSSKNTNINIWKLLH